MTTQYLEELASVDAVVSNAQGNLTQSRCRKTRALRVLVLSDQPEEANDLAQRISAWGHAVRTASDGFSALLLAAEQQPDVLLLDIEMPILDGTEIARQLRLSVPANDCFIIGLTEQADAACRERSVACGIDLLLAKPVDMSVLDTLLMLERVHVNLSPNAL